MPGGHPSVDNGAVADLLTEAEIRERLDDLSAWEQQGQEIRATFSRPSFADAVAFVVRVGFLAEAANHHPDISISWREVTLALTTHDAGGLTASDFELAARIQEVA